jgi:hypothetical protein
MKFCNVRGVYANLGRAHIVITLDTREEMIVLMERQVVRVMSLQGWWFDIYILRTYNSLCLK